MFIKNLPGATVEDNSTIHLTLTQYLSRTSERARRHKAVGRKTLRSSDRARQVELNSILYMEEADAKRHEHHRRRNWMPGWSLVIMLRVRLTVSILGVAYALAKLRCKAKFLITVQLVGPG